MMPIDEKVATRAVKQGPNANDVNIDVSNGAMLGTPVWEDRKGKRNWFAVLTEKKDAPGQFDRRFMERGKGKCYYVLGSLKVGDPVEFGADWEDPNEQEERKRLRWYGVVKAIASDKLTLIKTNGSEEAFSFSAGLRTAQEKPQNKLTRLQESKKALEEALKSVDSEIKALEEVIQKDGEKK